MITAVKTNPELGTLRWNLPQVVSYRANTPLQVVFDITNITDTDRDYQLQLRLERAGALIYGPTILTVDGKEWFTVKMMATLRISGALTLPETNCDLIVALYEKTEPPPGYAPQAEVRCTLQDPMAAMLRSLMPVMMAMMVFGLVMGLVKVIRR